jgi:hypothetical protein
VVVETDVSCPTDSALPKDGGVGVLGRLMSKAKEILLGGSGEKFSSRARSA